MKKINVLGKEWSVELEDMIEGDTLVIAKSGHKIFVEWIDFNFCRLEMVDHAQGCENLTDEEHEALRDRINGDLEKIARAAGYRIGANNYGYDGTLEYVGDDEELAAKIRGLY